MTREKAQEVVSMLVGPDDSNKLSLLYPEIQKHMDDGGTGPELANLVDEMCEILARNKVHVVADSQRDIRVIHEDKEVIYDDESDS
ncbi:hypothetical protein KAR91_17330 [Candidatus Pacearchaeota archaeon]|nr:hypothetical protein [Candidatus Pacearchaeota archaeon]